MESTKPTSKVDACIIIVVLTMCIAVGLLILITTASDDSTWPPQPFPHIAIVNPNHESIESHLKVLSSRIYPKTERPTVCDNCNNFNFTTIIGAKDVCAGNNPIDLLVLVTTIPKTFKERQAMRDTWLQHSRGNTANVRYVFLFGGGWSQREQAILYNESAQYGDILQEDYKDAYYNLSMKVMSGYKWALKFCNRATFTLRTADDNYINIPGLVKWVRTEGPKNMHVQIGYKQTHIIAFREKTKKWYITRPEFPEYVYPPYAMGTAFLYSRLALKDIVKAAPNIPYFAIEDVWFGLVMRQIHMATVHDGRFHMTLEGKLLKQLMHDECPNSGNFFSIHLVSPEAQPLLWRQCPNAL